MPNPMDPYSSYGQFINTLNALAGKNKEEMKNSLRSTLRQLAKAGGGDTFSEKISDDFLNELAGEIITAPKPINRLLAKLYWYYIINKRNPDESPYWAYKKTTDILPTIADNLQYHSHEIGMRSSYAPHKKADGTGTIDELIGSE